MFNLLTRNRKNKDNMLTYEDLVIAKQCVRRELQMRLRNLFISYVISTAMALLEGLIWKLLWVLYIALIFSEDGEQPCLSSHQETIEAFLNAAILSKEVDGTETSMSLVGAGFYHL